MTLLAAHRLHDIPVLIGDAVCTAPGSRSLKKKIYLISPNLAVGWTGYAITASSVIGELLSTFKDKIVTRSDIESFFKDFYCQGMYERDIKIVGWIVDDQPSPFIWQSSYPSEVFYNDYYFEGSGEKYYELLLQSNVLEGTTPSRDGTINIALAAAHEALMHCGQAFFSEQLDYASWDRTFGFAYEVIVYAYGRFWPLGSTMYLPWTYHWDPQTETGRAELAPRIWKMLFFGEYSVLQRNEYKDGNVSPKHYVIKPVYTHDIDLNQLESLSFTTKADFYVNYFVLHPTPIAGQRLGMCIVGDATSDKVFLTETDERIHFQVNNAFLNEKFREAIRSMTRQHNAQHRFPSVSTHSDAQKQSRSFHGKVGRNEPCPCRARELDGTPKKFKRCHGR